MFLQNAKLTEIVKSLGSSAELTMMSGRTQPDGFAARQLAIDEN